MPGEVNVSFRGQLYRLAVDPATATLGQLCSAVQEAIPGLAPHTLKLLLSKPRSQTLQLDRDHDGMLSSLGEFLCGSATASRSCNCLACTRCCVRYHYVMHVCMQHDTWRSMLHGATCILLPSINH
jgi:hypothetical protein